MRVAVIGLCALSAMILIVAVGGIPSERVWGQTRPGLPEGGWIALRTPAGEGRELLVVVAPQQQTISTYHIDLASGEIALGSVRNISADLQLDEFNVPSPTPQEIRRRLEQHSARFAPPSARPGASGLPTPR